MGTATPSTADRSHAELIFALFITQRSMMTEEDLRKLTLYCMRAQEVFREVYLEQFKDWPKDWPKEPQPQ